MRLDFSEGVSRGSIRIYEIFLREIVEKNGKVGYWFCVHTFLGNGSDI
jgi:hypothetical protein